MEYADWLRFYEGTTSGVIVAVDFESGRPEPDFSDLADQLQLPYSMVMPPVPTEPALDNGRSYVESWASELRHDAVDVKAIFGYCAGGSLACSLATELGRYGRKPQVLLIDPHLANGGIIYFQFMLAVQQFDRYLDPDEVDAAQQLAHAACSDPTLATVAELLPSTYRRISAKAFKDLEADEISDELCERFQQYLNYLMAARAIDYHDADEDVLALFSTEYEPPMHYRGRTLKFDVAHMKLLSDSRVADAVLELLAHQ